jgi:hypothetical protein
VTRFRVVSRVAARLRADYLGPDRLAEYAALLRQALDAGYRVVSLGEYRRLAAGATEPGRILALRHDVDIVDVAGNEAFYRVERSLGARATYYFRLTTVAPHGRLVQRLLEEEYEVGYHYEEAATIAKRDAIRDAAVLRSRSAEIRALFLANCATFRRRWNRQLSSASAHGDWANRRLGVRNNEFVDPELLDEAGLAFEAYDASTFGLADVYVSDVTQPPARWANGLSLADAIREERTPIYVLTHERQWHASVLAAARADARRIAEAAADRLPRNPARR